MTTRDLTPVETIESLKKELKDMIFSGGRLPVYQVIKPFSKEWASFGDAGDRAKGIDIPKEYNATSCLYEAKAGSYFPSHRHMATESIIALGECIIRTEKKEITLMYGDVVKIEEEELHDAYFVKDTLLIIVWHPEMENNNWVATR